MPHKNNRSSSTDATPTDGMTPALLDSIRARLDAEQSGQVIDWPWGAVSACSRLLADRDRLVAEVESLAAKLAQRPIVYRDPGAADS